MLSSRNGSNYNAFGKDKARTTHVAFMQLQQVQCFWQGQSEHQASCDHEMIVVTMARDNAFGEVQNGLTFPYFCGGFSRGGLFGNVNVNIVKIHFGCG